MGWRDFLTGINVSEYFKGLEFPCEKQDLIDYAQEHNAPDRILEMLDKLPDQEYGSLQQVLEAEIKSII